MKAKEKSMTKKSAIESSSALYELADEKWLHPMLQILKVNAAVELWVLDWDFKEQKVKFWKISNEKLNDAGWGSEKLLVLRWFINIKFWKH